MARDAIESMAHVPLADTLAVIEAFPPGEPFTVPAASGDITVTALFNRFADSDYGRHMQTQPIRFLQQFDYGADKMRTDLGHDVDPLGHQILTAWYATQLLSAGINTDETVTRQDGAVVLTAAILHDIGECTHPALKAATGAVVGDIAHGQKTDDDRQTEAAIRHKLYDELFSDIDLEVMTTIESIVSHADTSILHEIYETAHELQTLDTAKQAWLSHADDLETIYAGNFTKTKRSMTELGAIHSLGRDVFFRMMQQLVPRSQTFSYVDRYLQVVIPHLMSKVGMSALMPQENNKDKPIYGSVTVMIPTNP